MTKANWTGLRSAIRTAASFALVLLVSFPPIAESAAESPSKLLGTAWGLTLARDGTGFYNDLARFVVGSIAITYDVQPYRRAMRAFFDDPNACLYPKSLQGLLRTHDIPSTAGFIHSDPIQRTFVAVFSQHGKPTIARRTDLERKRVAYAMGSRVPEFLAADGADFIAVSDEVDKAKMLLNNHVDVMVGNLPDAQLVYQQLGASLPPFDAGFDPFPSARTRIVCHDTPGTRQFIGRINARLSKLLSSGELADFYELYGLDASLYIAETQLEEPPDR